MITLPTRREIRHILRWHGSRVRKQVLDMFIVGSVAKGTAGPESDIDVAVIISQVRGKTALKFTEEYHAKRRRLPHLDGRTIDIQFFYPDDPELAGYSKLELV